MSSVSAYDTWFVPSFCDGWLLFDASLSCLLVTSLTVPGFWDCRRSLFTVLGDLLLIFSFIYVRDCRPFSGSDVFSEPSHFLPDFGDFVVFFAGGCNAPYIFSLTGFSVAFSFELMRFSWTMSGSSCFILIAGSILIFPPLLYIKNWKILKKIGIVHNISVIMSKSYRFYIGMSLTIMVTGP